MRELDVMALALGGHEPQWRTCGCGREVMAVPCWDCLKAQREDEERYERARAANVPRGHEWAIGATDAELATRVRLEPEQGLTVDTARKLVLGARRALLVGGVGMGKTSLVVNCLGRRRSDAYFVRAESIARERVTRPLGRGEGPMYEQAMRVPILVLDDIGSEGKLEQEREAVSNLIRDRFADDLVTWVTTGLSSVQLKSRYDEAVTDRLMGRHGAVAIVFERDK